nr:AAA family ATPase [Gordonia rhizosphera]
MTETLTLADNGAAILEQIGALGSDQPTTRVDTHAATILLNGDRAWKFKRPVSFSYLDFSTPDRRRAALDAEYRLNSRTAPQLYHGVHAIRRDIDGTLSLDGPGETVDWVLEMTRFTDDALLVRKAEAGALDDPMLRRLATKVAELHRSAEVCDDEDGAARLRAVVDGNAVSMSRFPDILDPRLAAELTDRLRHLIDTHADLLNGRARAGRVRHGHGDLHLGNIAVLDDVPVPFDCLEFDAELATTDVLYDLAFLLMDLWARGLRHEANVVANTYFDLSPDDEHDYGLLPLAMSVRATVRAHVSAAQGDASRARDFLSLALRLIEPVAPRLVAIGGGSGTGKSTLAGAVGGDVGAAPGARILRSDVLRKRLAGVPAETRLPRSGYTRDMSRRVYDDLKRLAALHLTARMSVIADAVFGRPADRTAIAEVAAREDCRFTGIWLELHETERIARIEARGPDASDADAGVARRQTRSLQAPDDDDWFTVDAGGDALSPVRRHLIR